MKSSSMVERDDGVEVRKKRRMRCDIHSGGLANSGRGDRKLACFGAELRVRELKQEIALVAKNQPIGLAHSVWRVSFYASPALL